MSTQSLPSVDGYTSAVTMALDHFDNPAWLGDNSPLAAPYILGPYLDKYEYEGSNIERGNVLKAALQDAACHLESKQQRLLEATYFKRNSDLNNTGVALALKIPPRTFYTHKNAAIRNLSAQLSQTFIPQLRLERSIYRELVGREQLVKDIQADLERGYTVSITGVSGIGKTTLAAAVIKKWEEGKANIDGASDDPEQYAFWYTVRPSFNDYIANVLFAIAFYLRNCGAPRTWQQLIADQKRQRLEGAQVHPEQQAKVPERILGVIRHDLKSLEKRSLLFCIDEADLLDSEHAEHAQIIHLLEVIGEFAPLLLIGQRASAVLSNSFYPVPGFNVEEVSAFLHQADINHVEANTITSLHTGSKGNPALLTLILSLYKVNNSIEEGLKILEVSPSIEALYKRIWRRLKDEEKLLLIRLLVFQAASPTDAWAKEREVLHRLHEYGLLYNDNNGGTVVMPHIQKVGYSVISAECKPVLHLRAAEIWTERDEIIQAMYHCLEANQPALAVSLWYSNREREIERGRGSNALSMLLRISANDMSHVEDRNALLVARGELFKLAGQPEEAEANLQNIVSANKGMFPAYAQQLQAEVLEMQGRAEQALQRFRNALDSLMGSPINREVTILTRIGFLHRFHFQEVEKAQREALLARIKAEGFHGNIEEMDGNYKAARQRYQTAYELAEKLGQDNNFFLSRAYSQLGVLEIREGGDIDLAIELIEKAIRCDEHQGDIVSPLYDMLNLAYAYTQKEDYEKSLEIANMGLRRANDLGLSYLIAGLSCGVGEAYLGLNQLEEAERYARISLDTEEGFFRWSALALYGEIKGRQGLFSEAKTYLTEAIHSAEEAEDPFGKRYCQEKLVEMESLAEGDSDKLKANSDSDGK